ncbi:hypothetical protein [Kribbella sp. NPDC050459]|uniref:hypothetical protein n=1 Tax=Kribbella sp. NPDC050459 TaxID=3155785 RepID=UPI0033C0AE61
MDRFGAARLVMRGLALVAALVAVCAFHSSASEPAELSAPVVVAELIGPLHLDTNDVPSAVPAAEQHAHLLGAILLGASVVLLLALVAKALGLVAYAVDDLWRTPTWLGAADPPRSTAPSLTQLCVLRT